MPIDVQAMQIDLLSLTGHKFYGPKGAGALFIRKLKPQAGARARRSTAAGRRTACAPARSTFPGSSASAARRRSAGSRWRTRARGSPRCAIACSAALRADLDGVRVNGTLERRLPHNLHVSFDGVEGEALLMALGDLAVSTGSACSSGSQKPSHVLQAIGAVGDRAGASIRFGLGRTTTARGHRPRRRARRDRRRSHCRSAEPSRRRLTPCRITVAHSPDSDDAFMFYGLASGNVDTGGIERRPGPGGHRDAESRRVRRQVRGHRRVVPRLRAPASTVCAAAARREHGRRYGPIVVTRADGPNGVKGRTIAIPGHADDGVSDAAALRADRSSTSSCRSIRFSRPCSSDRRTPGLLIHEGQLTYADEGAEEDRRSGRVVGRSDRRPAAAARRQHHPARSRAGDDPQGVEDCCTTASPTRCRIAGRRSNTRSSSAAGSTRTKTDTFVGMYVNDLTLGYGERGRQGVERLHDRSVREGPDPQARTGRIRRLTANRSAVSQRRSPNTKPSRSTVCPSSTGSGVGEHRSGGHAGVKLAASRRRDRRPPAGRRAAARRRSIRSDRAAGRADRDTTIRAAQSAADHLAGEPPVSTPPQRKDAASVPVPASRSSRYSAHPRGRDRRRRRA